jgi:hypothetical protein
MTRCLTVLAVTVVLAAPAAAEPTVTDVNLGDLLYGPPVTADQLKDAVVFVEHWGVH